MKKYFLNLITLLVFTCTNICSMHKGHFKKRGKQHRKVYKQNFKEKKKNKKIRQDFRRKQERQEYESLFIPKRKANSFQELAKLKQKLQSNFFSKARSHFGNFKYNNSGVLGVFVLLFMQFFNIVAAAEAGVNLDGNLYPSPACSEWDLKCLLDGRKCWETINNKLIKNFDFCGAICQDCNEVAPPYACDLCEHCKNGREDEIEFGVFFNTSHNHFKRMVEKDYSFKNYKMKCIFSTLSAQIKSPRRDEDFCHRYLTQYHKNRSQNNQKKDSDSQAKSPVHQFVTADYKKLTTNCIAAIKKEYPFGLSDLTRGSLHAAIGDGYYDIAETLIDERIGIRERDTLGRTPLHVAIWAGHNKKIISKLIKAGAKINVKSYHTPPKTPLDYAYDKIKSSPLETVELIHFLEENGAKRWRDLIKLCDPIKWRDL